MEINKQLFEDVLSGKLKGTFVLKNGKQFNDKLLTDIYKSTVVLGGATFYFNGKPVVSIYNGVLDIVDFIPEYRTIDLEMLEYCRKDFEFMQTLSKAINNMNTLEIEIPEGKEIDWKESEKQNKIVLKDKQLTYKDVCKKLFENKESFYIHSDGYIESIQYDKLDSDDHLIDANNATTKHQLECILAKNKLATVAKYLNDGWKPVYNMQSQHLNEGMWVILSFISGIHPVKVMQNSMVSCFGTILFKSTELAQQAIEILGEETVKLALEPLGI